MLSRGRRKSWSALLAISKFLWFCFFQSECLCCTHNILPRKRVGRNAYILQCSLSPRWAAPCCCVCRRCGQALPSRSFGWAESQRSGGVVGMFVRSLSSRVAALTLHSFLSLSLRHNIHIDTQNTRCLTYSACPKSVAPFIFPPSSPYTESQAKMRERLYKSFIFFYQAISSYDAHNPKNEKKIIIGNW